MSPSELEIHCPHCNSVFRIGKQQTDPLPKFCSFCGNGLDSIKTKTLHADLSMPGSTGSTTSVSFIQGHVPEQKNIQFSLGPYQITRVIGKGGMGEVYLAYDTNCGRKIALKRIRSDLTEHIQMHNRFLKEARITSQLTHPSIIPIYAIHGQDQLTYYTMPFVEGDTLKEILRKTRLQEKRGETLDHIGGSIPALVRIFLSVCQAIAYAHSKGVLHRDIKPENIIVGRYGEVLILDWGLAKIMDSPQEEGSEETTPSPAHITNLGKVVGTISFMAPERALGNEATYQTDVYSLGVILYQILTLRHPFKRGDLKEFRENMHLETIPDPLEIAPYRDIPRVLARIALKCIAKDVEQRYQTVDELIREIENYIEGRAEWSQYIELDIHNKNDWEFQENVLIAEHVAITRNTDVSDWVNLMISKASFRENLKLEAEIRLSDKGHGLGFLMSIPEAAERTHLNDGYCLWLGTQENRSTRLLRSTVEVMQTPDSYLKPDEWITITIEKIENNIYLYLNGVLQFSYISHLPLAGTHIGLIARDAEFEIKNFRVFLGSQSVMVNCLAVPDAFLAHKDYDLALNEYRRIGYSFPGRAEGREAMFRAGVTLLEQARTTQPQDDSLYDAALEEFEKLHGTPGAPLEYLGKALVYQALGEFDEEIKCFELAFRRYPRHPLLSILEEQIVYRMHASSRANRMATYKFILLTVRHLHHVAKGSNAKKLFASLRKHWEPLPFIEEDPSEGGSEILTNTALATVLAFWLAKPYIFTELISEQIKLPVPSTIMVCNALFCLVELGCWELARKKLEEFTHKRSDVFSENGKPYHLINILIKGHEYNTSDALEELLLSLRGKTNLQSERVIVALLNKALLERNLDLIHSFYEKMEARQLETSQEATLLIDAVRIAAYLLQNKWQTAGDLLHNYSLELLNQETTLLHFLYGCWLFATEGIEIATIHFLGSLDVAYPRSWALYSHLFNGHIKEGQGWFPKAFLWEKRQLYSQVSLFEHCQGHPDAEQKYLALAKAEFLPPEG